MPSLLSAPQQQLQPQPQPQPQPHHHATPRATRCRAPPRPVRCRKRGREDEHSAAVHQVFAGDVSSLVFAHLSVMDLFSLSHVSRAVRTAARQRLGEFESLTISSSSHNRGLPFNERVLRHTLCLPSADLGALFRSLPFPNLLHLDLQCKACDVASLEGVPGHGLLPKLRSLNLQVNRIERPVALVARHDDHNHHDHHDDHEGHQLAANAKGEHTAPLALPAPPPPPPQPPQQQAVGGGSNNRPTPHIRDTQLDMPAALPGFLSKLGATVCHFEVWPLNCTLGPTWFTQLPPLPNLKSLTFLEVCALPDQADLAHFFAHTCPGLSTVEIEESHLAHIETLQLNMLGLPPLAGLVAGLGFDEGFEDEDRDEESDDDDDDDAMGHDGEEGEEGEDGGRVPTPDFARVLVEALATSKIRLTELKVSSANMDLARTLCAVPSLKALGWHDSLSIPPTDISDDDWLGSLRSSNLFSLCVLERPLSNLSEAGLQRLAAACPKLQHIHLQGVPLAAPERSAFPLAIAGEPRVNSPLLLGFRHLRLLSELELAVIWPDDTTDEQDEVLLAQLADTLARLCAQSLRLADLRLTVHPGLRGELEHCPLTPRLTRWAERLALRCPRLRSVGACATPVNEGVAV